MDSINFCIQHPVTEFFSIVRASIQGPNFWTAVGAIGEWIGANATFSAVLLALQSTKLSLRSKIQRIIEPCVVAQYGTHSKVMLSWTVVNIGLRPVRPLSAGTIIKSSGKQTVFPGYINFKRSLEQSDREEFLIPFDEFISGIIDSGAKCPETLTFYVSDTQGTRFYLKWKKFDWSSVINK